jgi:hypothetical protein
MRMPIGDMISQAGIMQHRPPNKIVQGKQSLRSCGGNQVSGHELKFASVETMSVRKPKQQWPYESFFAVCIDFHLTNGKAEGAFLSAEFPLKGCSLWSWINLSIVLNAICLR